MKQAAKRDIWGQRRVFAEGLPKKLRWFMLPFEAQQILCNAAKTIDVEPPFSPTGGGPKSFIFEKNIADLGIFPGLKINADELPSRLPW